MLKRLKASSIQPQAFAFLALILCLPSFTLAQANSQVVGIGTPQKIVAQRGTTVTETLQVKVQQGYHVNSNKPKDEFLIPLKLTWNGPLSAKQVLYPEPETTTVGDQSLNVFTGTFPLTTNFTVPSGAQPGIAIMQGTLHFQACDSVSCKRPGNVTVQVPVTIE